MPREGAARQPLSADIDGFSLHAAVRVEAHGRKRLEQRCRYITRPALPDEWVQLNAVGQVEPKLKTPWRDGTPHLVMSPLEFMRRLAALVRWSRQHMTGWPDSGRSPAAAPGRQHELIQAPEG
ncbi:transposase [Roseateles sp. P5_E7]